MATNTKNTNRKKSNQGIKDTFTLHMVKDTADLLYAIACFLQRSVVKYVTCNIKTDTCHALHALTCSNLQPVELHTMACKAAIKGGWTSDPAELKILVEKVQSGEVRYCPHGRPVVVKVTKYELEKLFKRA